MYALKKSGFHSLMLYSTTDHLQPLAVAANVTQAAFCRLDEALLTFGYLVTHYALMEEANPLDHDACQVIVDGLESRWLQADQLPFIVCVIINPFYRTRPFARIPPFLLLNVLSYSTSLYCRIMRTNAAPTTFMLHLRQYLEGKGPLFNDLDAKVNNLLATAVLEVSCPLGCTQKVLF
jgi:hypothetical protein